MGIFFNFSPTSTHLHPLQVENCDSNSRLVVDEDDYGKFRLEGGLAIYYKHPFAGYVLFQRYRRFLSIDSKLVFGFVFAGLAEDC